MNNETLLHVSFRTHLLDYFFNWCSLFEFTPAIGVNAEYDDGEVSTREELKIDEGISIALMQLPAIFTYSVSGVYLLLEYEKDNGVTGSLKIPLGSILFLSTEQNTEFYIQCGSIMLKEHEPLEYNESSDDKKWRKVKHLKVVK